MRFKHFSCCGLSCDISICLFKNPFSVSLPCVPALFPFLPIVRAAGSPVPTPVLTAVLFPASDHLGSPLVLEVRSHFLAGFFFFFGILAVLQYVWASRLLHLVASGSRCHFCWPPENADGRFQQAACAVRPRSSILPPTVGGRRHVRPELPWPSARPVVTWWITTTDPDGRMCPFLVGGHVQASNVTSLNAALGRGAISWPSGAGRCWPWRALVQSRPVPLGVGRGGSCVGIPVRFPRSVLRC